MGSLGYILGAFRFHQVLEGMAESLCTGVINGGESRQLPVRMYG